MALTNLIGALKDNGSIVSLLDTNGNGSMGTFPLRGGKNLYVHLVHCTECTSQFEAIMYIHNLRQMP